MVIRNRYVLLADFPIIALAAVGAFVLRFDWLAWPTQQEFSWFLVAALLIKPAVFMAYGMYGRYWPYASMRDFLALGLAVVTSSASLGVLVTIALFTHVIEQFSRSVVLIDALLTFVATGGFRASMRIWFESRRASLVPRSRVRRILIVGAGEAGMLVARELIRNPQRLMVPIGFVDDDGAKHGKRILGLPVFGPVNQLAAAVQENRINEVTIAMPSASGKLVREIAEICRAIGVASRVMPGVYELLDGDITVNRLRKVDIGDLLRRSEIAWMSEAGNYIAGRRVLVTGGGGSIGLELCRQVAHRGPERLILLGHGENSLFEAAAHLRRAFPDLPMRTIVADVREAGRIKRVFARERPDVVFHAAAHKHVPLMEENPEEAISNNVLGTRNVVYAAAEVGVERFVLISTDKAVSPSSLMGASKRVAEAVVRDAATRFSRPFVVVRFGNVLGSRGSVVPIFKQQIENGGPVLVTHPEMRRYFMTIPEAVHLVLEAGGMGIGGELFVLRMGEPVRIVDLAKDLIRLSGSAAEGIDIVFTGMRPGEKLEEALWEAGAAIENTGNPEILRVREPHQPTSEDLAALLERFAQAVAQGDAATVERLLDLAIPTFARSRAQAPRHDFDAKGGGPLET